MAMCEGPVTTLPVSHRPHRQGQTLDTVTVLLQDLQGQGEVEGQGHGEVEGQGHGEVEGQGQGQGDEVTSVVQCCDALSPMSIPSPLGKSGDPEPMGSGPTQAQTTTNRDLDEMDMDRRPPTHVCCEAEPIESGLTLESGLVTEVNGRSGKQHPCVREPIEERERPKETPSPPSSPVLSPPPSPPPSPGQTLGLVALDTPQEGCLDATGTGEGSSKDLLCIVKHKPSAIVFSGDDNIDNISPPSAFVTQSSDGEESSLADEEEGDDDDDVEEEEDEEVPELPQYKEFLVSRRRRNLSRNRKGLRKGQELPPTGSLIGLGCTNKTSSKAKEEEEEEEEAERKQVRKAVLLFTTRPPLPVSSISLLYQPPLPASSTSLLYQSPLPVSSTSLLYQPPLPASSTSLLYHLLYHPPLPVSSTSLLYQPPLPASSPSLFYQSPLPVSSTSLLYQPPLPVSSTSLLYQSPLPASSTSLLYQPPLPVSSVYIARSPWCDSMSQLMRKLDQLNLDIQEALSAASSSHSDNDKPETKQPEPCAPALGRMMSRGLVHDHNTSRPSNRPPESTVSSPRRCTRPLARRRPLTRSSIHSPSHLHYRQRS
ncbi:unnamed protein product, partial [Coregonus sp. 'balchen']